MTFSAAFNTAWKARLRHVCGVKSTFLLAIVLLSLCGRVAAQTSTDATIQSLQVHLKMYPQDFKSYDALGASYIQKGRETADASYYELAKETLNKSLDLVSNDPAAASAKTHMAVVAMACVSIA